MIEEFKQHLAAFSAGNWAEYKAGFSSDVLYEEVATNQRAKGVDSYIDYVQRWKRAFPDLTGTVVQAIESGDRMMAEVEWKGTQTAALEGPFGSIAATNKRALVRAVIVARFRDDKVIETRHYFDLLGLLMQLGVAPIAGAPSPQPTKTAVPPTRH
jgi:steroid delta-isomerase-like uncharacterized protein